MRTCNIHRRIDRGSGEHAVVGIVWAGRIVRRFGALEVDAGGGRYVAVGFWESVEGGAHCRGVVDLGGGEVAVEAGVLIEDDSAGRVRGKDVDSGGVRFVCVGGNDDCSEEKSQVSEILLHGGQVIRVPLIEPCGLE